MDRNPFRRIFMQPQITVTRFRPGVKPLADSLALLTKKHILVGVPATSVMDRKRELLDLSQRLGKKRRARVEKMALTMAVNNAELLYIHTNGSPLHNIPPRPVIEPALEDKENQQRILPELKLAAQAAMKGDKTTVDRQLGLAATEAVNAAKGWFTNSKNGWAPNAPGTIRAKGSSRPLIDTGALRQAITSVIEER
jgi:hypothetical protein